MKSATTQIALIRGINVGTAKRVAMADLRKMLAGLGYSDVRTLLNSGNAVFTTTDSSSAVTAERFVLVNDLAAAVEFPCYATRAVDLLVLPRGVVVASGSSPVKRNRSRIRRFHHEAASTRRRTAKALL